MGAPCSFSARSTISMARSTPAQKPRGLASRTSMSSTKLTRAALYAGVCALQAAVGKALFLPRIRLVVIAAHFPESGPVLFVKFDSGQPFRALPRIAFGHDQPHRSAVLGL